MARAATSRLKVNPPLGRMPVLQFRAPAELAVDSQYQRDIENSASQSLIRKIAQHWNWDLCLPLVVSQRDGKLFVIDGQHRHAAALLRGDIPQLPCVVVEYAGAADEAASFVHLNQQRRPLSKLDVFKAAVASEDPEACAIARALKAAGLSVAPHQNYISWKPGMVANIGGIEGAWRKYGAKATEKALEALARSWPGEVLRYAGTAFPGIAAICGQYPKARPGEVAAMVRQRSQVDWRSAVMQRRAIDPNLRFATASAAVLVEAWRVFCDEELPEQAADVADENPLPGFIKDHEGMSWCEQCEGRVNWDEGLGCKSRHCSLRRAA